jgi:hypothetical protein
MLPRTAITLTTAAILAVASLSAVRAQTTDAAPAPETYSNPPDLFDSGKLLATSGVTQLEAPAAAAWRPGR